MDAKITRISGAGKSLESVPFTHARSRKTTDEWFFSAYYITKITKIKFNWIKMNKIIITYYIFIIYF